MNINITENLLGGLKLVNKMNKKVIITGATGLMGRYLVERFLKDGFSVVAVSRSIDKLEEVLNHLLSQCNLSLVEYDILEVEKDLPEQFLTASQLVNGARMTNNLELEPDGTVSNRSLISEFELSVCAPNRLVHELSNFGCLKKVVNISSIYGVVTFNPHLYDDVKKALPYQYSVSKAAMNHLTKELAVKFAPLGLNVNGIAFGGVVGRADKEFEDKYRKLTPLGGMLELEQCYGPLKFLLSEDSNGITGQTIIVDGGWTLW